ncbi:tetratricopeptide repeat protein [Steroidobacter flavus]|uniref:Tetratricopeptide repeat protein n=1 Tax=Steroidobacter flavus TaxID=1842136 RepID=A0ABV8SIU6_9GAMM
MKSSRYYDEALAEAERPGADLHKALRLLNRAYMHGDHRAGYALATWHLHGKGDVVPRNLAKAVPLLREAANADHAEAAYDLAVCYEKGVGVKKSERKAARFYLKAALLGDKQSLYEVGRCYWHGLGVKRDRSIAGAWLDQAAKFKISE